VGLTSLNILNNNIAAEQAQQLIKIKHEKKMVTLCGLQGSETELDLSGKLSGAADALMLVEDIKHNTALSKLKINSYWLPIQELKTATELDLSGKGLKAEDTVIVSSCIR